MSLTFVCNGLTPVVVGQAIDRAIAVGSISTLWLWVVILLGIFLVNAAAGWFGRALFQRAGLEIGHELRMAVTDRISHPKGMAGKQRTARGAVSYCLIRHAGGRGRGDDDGLSICRDHIDYLCRGHGL